jgi:hypothetical protein
MDQRFKALGYNITECAFRARCPGILEGRLTNDPTAGVPPRGLFIRPPTASLDTVGIVILGLNPGRADEAEKRILRDSVKKAPERLFEYVHAETVLQMARWPYWQRMDELVRLLAPEISVVLAAELVFCECAPELPGERKKHPGARAIRFCSKLHLEKVVQTVPPSAVFICVGGDAREWLRASPLGDTARWAWIEHVTGAWGAFSGMFEAPGRLKGSVLRTWQATVEGHVRGRCLSRDDEEVRA